MNIEPLPTGRPPEISVTEPIEPAYERVKQMLFRPFDLGKWFTIGLGAWLAGLGEAGGGGFHGFGGNYNFNGHHSNDQVLQDFRHGYYQVRDYVADNINWILPLAVIAGLLLTVFWLLLLWLNSRGKFMFLHCVALNVAEVEVPWMKHAKAANSLFRFRLVVGFLGLVVILPLAVFMVVLIGQMMLGGEVTLARVLPVVGLGAGLALASLVFGLVHKALVDFVVPIMYLRGGGCLAAWSEFFGLLTGNFWRFVLYVLFQIVLGMVIGVMVLTAIVVTCCIAGCLMALPFVGTVVLLPVLIFKRAYPLYYLRQFGGKYDVFAGTKTNGE
ncbi:MAG TPA: hypothetical protein VK815_13830 [Candidatus Acidoferrales bacterium]|jgi:hypothetical protein|nr:hypothetical protein [Candidatus Acidoferrales bacterium]